MQRLLMLAVIGCAAVIAQEEGKTPGSKGEEHAASSEPSPLWKWANFAILAVGLGYLMNKHLPPFFRTRTAEIQKGIADAQHIKREAEKNAAEMDARLKAIGADIEKFRAQAASEMQQEGERIRQETAAQIRRIEEHAALEIESAGKTARRELKRYAADLALDLAEQRVRARLDSGTEGALVDRFVSDLGRQGSKNPGSNN